MNNKFEKEENMKCSKIYEDKMKKFEHTQLVHKEKAKKALRDGITWQIREKESNSFRSNY